MILVSIKADFDTFDTADFIARKISKKIDGVTKTAIKSMVNQRNKHVTNFSDSYGIGPVSIAGGYQFTGLIPQNEYSENRIEPLKSESTTLTITCTSAALHHVEQMLINSGAMNLKKIV